VKLLLSLLFAGLPQAATITSIERLHFDGHIGGWYYHVNGSAGLEIFNFDFGSVTNDLGFVGWVANSHGQFALQAADGSHGGWDSYLLTGRYGVRNLELQSLFRAVDTTDTPVLSFLPISGAVTTRGRSVLILA
jgi:hypothetical protein